MSIKRTLSIALVLAVILSTVLVAPAQAYDMPYYIQVDISSQIVTIYDMSTGKIARQMLCSTGKNDSTPTGTFYLPAKDRSDERSTWYCFYTLNCWAKYATRIVNGYLFHSIPYNTNNNDDMNKNDIKNFGTPASHGCVRLRVEDAKFIAKNCLKGTRVDIIKSGDRNDELRELLYVSSYTGENGMTYAEFLGASADDLGRDASGAEVLDLQNRLTALGYFSDSCSGVYSISTVAAVKLLQNDLGMTCTGIATKDFLDIVYSDDAPVSVGNTTLQDGQSGPVVKKLQTALQNLGLYDGEMDSVYDVDVADAVKTFQAACGYTVDGVATAEIQQAIYYHESQLKEQFGDNCPEAEVVWDSAWRGVVVTEAAVNVRLSPDTEGEVVAKVHDGDVVTVLENGNDWSKILYKGYECYIRSKYLQVYNTDVSMIQYTDGSETYCIGHTVAEYYAGASTFASEFSGYYSSGSFATAYQETYNMAAVNTGDDDIVLNLRADASPDSEVLCTISNGISMRTFGSEDGWTKVAYERHIGYLMTDYLESWTGTLTEMEERNEKVLNPETEEELSEEETTQYTENNEKITAIVVVGAEDNGEAPVYDSDSADANLLGHVPEGLELDVVQMSNDDSWVLISYQGHQGYMLDTNLRIQLGTTD